MLAPFQPVPGTPAWRNVQAWAVLGTVQRWGHYSGRKRGPLGAGLENSVGLEPLGTARPLHYLQPTIYPTGLHISLEAAQFVVSDAPSYHNLRAFVVLFVAVLGQVRDGVLGVLQLHIHQQGVGYLAVETLQG